MTSWLRQEEEEERRVAEVEGWPAGWRVLFELPEGKQEEECYEMAFGFPQPLRVIGRPTFGSVGLERVDARRGLPAQGKGGGSGSETESLSFCVPDVF